MYVKLSNFEFLNTLTNLKILFPYVFITICMLASYMDYNVTILQQMLMFSTSLIHWINNSKISTKIPSSAKSLSVHILTSISS